MTANIQDLKEVKRLSDERKYQLKRMMLRRLMQLYPNEFRVDSDDGRGIVGVTHDPTGFRYHTPKSNVGILKGLSGVPEKVQ